jgi:hypothetical protein
MPLHQNLVPSTSLMTRKSSDTSLKAGRLFKTVYSGLTNAQQKPSPQLTLPCCSQERVRETVALATSCRKQIQDCLKSKVDTIKRTFFVNTQRQLQENEISMYNRLDIQCGGATLCQQLVLLLSSLPPSDQVKRRKRLRCWTFSKTTTCQGLPRCSTPLRLMDKRQRQIANFLYQQLKVWTIIGPKSVLRHFID